MSMFLMTSCNSRQTYSEGGPIAEDEDTVLVIGDQAQGRYLLKDGDYQATKEGLQGPVTVEMQVKDGYISKIEVVSHEENPGVVEAAFDKMIEEMVDKQSAQVDVIAGATEASQALKEAVRDCIRQAESSS
ncbi:MAG: FMN-binding protein [Tissierellia bacterium]|nr:FMN-binding protein [Tissierellia bacterium]